MASKGITITIDAESSAAASKLSSFFSEVTGHLNELTKAGDFVKELGGKIAAAFTLGAIVEEFKHAIESAEDFGKAVQKTGLSFTTLNELRILAQQNGVAFESLTLGLTLFNDRIYQAVRMGGDSAKVFRDLKVAITDNNGALLPTETILREVMDRFADMPDGIIKTAEAQELFGRGSRELIPVLNEGASALDRVKASGDWITPEMYENAKRYRETLVELHNALDGIFRTASVQIVPILQSTADWMKNAEVATDGESKASDQLVDAFRGLATLLLIVKAGVVVVFEVIGNLAGLMEAQFEDAIHTTVDLFGKWWEAIKKISASLLDMIKAASDAGKVLTDLAKGNFSAAADGAKAFLERTKKDIADIGKTTKNATLDSWSAVWSAIERHDIMTLGVVKRQWEQFKKEAMSMGWGLDALWFDRSDEKEKPKQNSNARTGAAGAKPGGASAEGQAAPIVSEEARKLMDDVDKQYREATQSKLSLLDFERDQILKKLNDEIRDQKTLEEEKTKVVETFAAKRQAILDEQADHQNKRNLEDVKAQVDQVQKNPDLTEVEKKQQLIPLLAQERQLLQQILDLENQRAKDPGHNQEEQEKAKDQVAALQRELADNQAASQKAAQTPFEGIRKELEQQNDLQTEVASSFGKVFNGAIQSVGSNLTAVIMKTETWRQALLRIGETILSSIINAIIEMGVRYVLTQLMMAAFGKAIAASSTAALAPIASAQSAIWATPATLSTIASYGGAAAAAPGEIGAAIALTLGSVAAFATGGLVDGPGTATSDSVLARLSRGEYVMPADRVRDIGTDYLEALRNGGDIARAVPSSITRPVTSQPGFQSGADDGSASGSGGAGGAGGVTVQGHKVTFIQPANRQEMLDAMRSSEGEKIWVQHGQKNKMKIGVGT